MQEIVANMLEMRGLSDIDADEFLHPKYTNIGNPSDLKDLNKSVKRVYKAIQNNEKIAIYADYDCDGIPGAVVLSDMFDIIGFTNYVVYIPDRHKEGYGLHIPAIDSLVADGVNLIITIDVGITAVDQAKYCKEKGIDLIITDHHLPLKLSPPPASPLAGGESKPFLIVEGCDDFDNQIIPDAYAVINPKQNNPSTGGNKYGDDMLCGSGVIFTFVRGFLDKYRAEYDVPVGWEKWLLDMVAIATLSDMVPLLKENRILAYYGLQVLKKTRRPGLQLLLQKAGVDMAHLVEDDVTFTLAPRLNAASRMDTPVTAFKLLKTKDAKEAVELSAQLESLNTDRKTKVANIMKQVKKTFEKSTDKLESNVVVVGDPNWSVGVLGLVASKIVDEHNKTVFVWARDESGIIKGSCRSNCTCHLVSIMSSAPVGTFVTFGGHEGAGGFTVNNDAIHTLAEVLNSVHENSVIEKENNNSIEALEISLSLVTDEVYKTIQNFAPFGVANTKPLFLFKNVLIESAKEFGKDKNHLEIVVSHNSGKKIKAISFFKTTNDFEEKLVPGIHIDLFACIEESRFMGRVEMRLRIESLNIVL
ncbi:MAG: single-stranded-DNA-specific exonuclease RecJ [Minisyncoccia bacterium]